MHASRRNQSDQMKRTVFARFHGCDQRRVFKKLAARNRFVNPHDVQRHYPARANVQMPDFGIAKLALRQSGSFARSFDQCMRIFFQILIQERSVGLPDGIAFKVFGMSKSIENDQRKGSSSQSRFRHTGIIAKTFWDGKRRISK